MCHSRAQARFAASLQLVELGRLSEAVAALDRVIKLAPKQAKAFFNRALIADLIVLKISLRLPVTSLQALCNAR